MDDVQAVRLGAGALAAKLAAPRRVHEQLSAEAEAHFWPLLEAVCAQILHFFTQRSAFVARTLVDQSRALDAPTPKPTCGWSAPPRRWPRTLVSRNAMPPISPVYTAS